MKIVVLDGYTENPGDLSWDELGKLGDLTVYDRTSLTDEGEIISRIGDAEVVFTNKTPISKAVIDACPNMKFISLLATGYNVVDYVYAGEKGIPVTNVPTYGTASVSQFSIALLLEICHHIGHHDETVKAGKWENCQDWCYWDYPLIELAGKTYGLLGCGNIGVHTAAIASALGMHVIAYDMRQRDEALQLGVEYVSLDELFARSDVLGLQMPLFPFNTGIINRENIAKMKDGVIIINNSRGQMVVEQDLADALNSGKVAAAGLDVVMRERFYQLLLEDYARTGRTFIISTHIIEEAASVFERVLILDDGRIIEDEETEELVDQFRYVSGAAEEVDRVCEGMTVVSERTMGRRKTAAVRDTAGRRAADLEGMGDVDVSPLNLQNVFVALCGHEPVE